MLPTPVPIPLSVFRIVWIGSPQLFQPLAHLHSIIILKSQHRIRSFVVLNDSEPFPTPEAIRQLWQLSKEIEEYYRTNGDRTTDYRIPDYRAPWERHSQSYHQDYDYPYDSARYIPTNIDDVHQDIVEYSPKSNPHRQKTSFTKLNRSNPSYSELIPLRLDHLSSNAMRTFANKSPETIALINPTADPSSSEFVATYTGSKELSIYRYIDWVRSSPRPKLAGVVESTITYQPFQ